MLMLYDYHKQTACAQLCWSRGEVASIPFHGTDDVGAVLHEGFEISHSNLRRNRNGVVVYASHRSRCLLRCLSMLQMKYFAVKRAAKVVVVAVSFHGRCALVPCGQVPPGEDDLVLGAASDSGPGAVVGQGEGPHCRNLSCCRRPAGGGARCWYREGFPRGPRYADSRCC